MAERKSTGYSKRLAVSIDHGGAVAPYRQIVDHLWLGVIEGDLEPGDRLPTVRKLAIDLGVHPNTVARAYHELELLGVIATGNRDGTFVCLTQPDGAALERRRRFDDLCNDAATRAAELGFSVDELIDALGDLRSRQSGSIAKED